MSFLNNLGSDAYSGVAGFGRIMSIGVATLTTLVGAVAIYAASKMIINKEPTVDQQGKPIDPVQQGWTIIAVALLFLAVVWGWVWLTQKYKIFAAATGVRDIIGFL